MIDNYYDEEKSKIVHMGEMVAINKEELMHLKTKIKFLTNQLKRTQFNVQELKARSSNVYATDICDKIIQEIERLL
jgi:hypothetical protein